MLDSEVKVKEVSSLSSTPTLTETQSDGELPPEVVLAILYVQAKQLEKQSLAQILTGVTPKGEPVTYIRMVGISLDKARGFVLPTDANTANGE
jgi:hypothetical protein